MLKSIKDVNMDSLAAFVKAHLKDDEIEVTDVDLRQKFDIGKHGQTGFCSDMKGATIKYRYVEPILKIHLSYLRDDNINLGRKMTGQSTSFT